MPKKHFHEAAKIYAVQIKVEHDILHINRRRKRNFKLRLSLSLVYFSADNFQNLENSYSTATAEKGKVKNENANKAHEKVFISNIV